jgi:predicted nucleic acid-binding protein
MAFLDSSAIIEYLGDNQTVIDYLADRKPWWTSTLCVFEVLDGITGMQGFDPVEARQQFSGMQAIEFNEQLAIEAARLQHASMQNGTRLSARDAMIAATARSTGDKYVVADSDFETEPLEAHMDVVNLSSE